MSLRHFQEVVHLSSHSNTLLVRRDLGDTVNIGSGWTPDGNETVGPDTFEIFTQGAAVLKVQTAVSPDLVGVHRYRNFFVDLNGNGGWDRIADGDLAFRFNQPGQAIAGDFDGDGDDEVGVHRGRSFFLDANGNGHWDQVAGGDLVFRFNQTGAALAGDFNGDGIDEVGVHRGLWYFIDANGNGRWDRITGGDRAFRFDQRGMPLVGRWIQPATLLAIPVVRQTFESDSSFTSYIEPLTPQALDPIVDHAIGIWLATPLTAQQEKALRDVELTVVLHELGHVLGWEDLDPLMNPDDLMAEALALGTRRLSFPDAIDAAIAGGV